MDHGAHAPSGPRERKKRRTRAAIVAAALDLFERQGYEETTIDEIAEAAEVSARTFFRYFATKDEVVFTHEADDRGALLSALAGRGPDVPDAVAAAEAVLALATSLDKQRERVVRISRLVARSQSLQARAARARAGFEHDLAAGLSARAGYGPDVNPACALVAAVLLTALEVAVHKWRDDPVPSLPERLRGSFDDLAATTRLVAISAGAARS